jgi:hypothetical protein
MRCHARGWLCHQYASFIRLWAAMLHRVPEDFPPHKIKSREHPQPARTGAIEIGAQTR